jgi:hypothetical protein
MGNVTIKSSYNIWKFDIVWPQKYKATVVVNWTIENKIIILKEWKLVASAALHIIRHYVIHFNDFWFVWKLLSMEHYPLYNYMERCAHYDTLAPDPTAKVTLPLRSSWK